MTEREREFKGNVIFRVSGFRAKCFRASGFENIRRKVTKNIIRESFVRIQYVKKIVSEKKLKKIIERQLRRAYVK